MDVFANVSQVCECLVVENELYAQYIWENFDHESRISVKEVGARSLEPPPI